jgi:hypothetical protein
MPHVNYDMKALEDISFWGFNTKTFKDALDKIYSEMTEEMTGTESEAYSLGVRTALSLLEQTFTAGTDNSSLFFYHPDIEKITEFDIYDLKDWMDEL